ncbi:MAG: hypothetical protein ABFD50_21605 [Smithella sp.]
MMKLKYLNGHLLMIQEDRIRMQADDGRGFLLTLVPNAEMGDLEDLLKSKARVLVRFEGEPDLDSGIAHSLKKIR